MLKFLFQLICLVLLAISLFGLYVAIGYSLRIFAARNWIPVEAKVTQYEQKLVQSARGNFRFSVKIEYEYFAKGALRKGDRLSFFRSNAYSPNLLQEMLGEGNPDLITIYISPTNPDVSVVYKGGGGMTLRLLVCALLAFGLTRLVVYLYLRSG